MLTMRRLFAGGLMMITAAVIPLAGPLGQTSIYPAPGDHSNETVVIGCVQRAAQTVGETKATATFNIQDFRSTETFRVEGDQNMLTFHVGHEVELRGLLTDPQSRTSPRNIKMRSIMYLAPTCWKK